MIALLILFAFTPHYFIHHSDPQIGRSPEGEPNLDSAVAQIGRLRPAPSFIYVAGDIADNPLDSATVHDQWTRARTRFNRLSIPKYYVAGNNDLGYPSELQGIPRMLYWYRNFWGPDWYSFDRDSCHFIALNSTLLDLASGHIHYPAALAQDSFLRRDIQSIQGRGYKQLFFLYHFPTYNSTADEANQTGNVHRPRRDTILRYVRDLNFSAILNGHIHADGQTLYRSALLQAGLPTCTGPLTGTGYRIVKVFKNGIETFTVFLSAPVDSVPLVNIVTPSASPETVQVNQTVTFQAAVDTVRFPDWRGLSFRWHFGDGDSSWVRNTTHVYRDTGNYLVAFTGYQSPRKAANYHLRIRVKPPSAVASETRGGPDGCTIDLPAIIRGTAEFDIKFSDVWSSRAPTARIGFYSISGRRLGPSLEVKAAGTQRIRLPANLPGGVYFVEVVVGPTRFVRKGIHLK